MRTLHRLGAALLTVVVAACAAIAGAYAVDALTVHPVDTVRRTGVVDQCARRTAFLECLRASETPNGATLPGWGDALGECRAFALEVALRPADQVAPMCRAE